MNGWDVVEAGIGKDDQDAQLEAIRARLEALPVEELPAFQAWLGERLDEAYTWDLWAAAYVIMGGCSDDGFEYFRAWLIGRGREVFERAVREPDSLADVELPEDPMLECELEGLLYLANEVYEDEAGEEMPYEPREGMAEPRGEPWDEDDEEELRRRVPRLMERCWTNGEG